MIAINSSFGMNSYILKNAYIFQKVIYTFNFFGYWTFWVQHDVRTHILRFFAASNLEVCQKFCALFWHLFKIQESMTLTIWTSTTITYPSTTLIFDFYRFHHRHIIIKFFWYYIYITVDRLTKMAYFIPHNKTNIKEGIAWLFLANIYQYHGLLEDIISDRRPQFVSKFWQSLFKSLKVDIKLFHAFHPQNDGQIECINQVLEQHLCCTNNYR